MAEPDDLERRVSAVEADVASIREQVAASAADAEAARYLAAGADRDVSEVRAELRAHLLAINALHEDHRSLERKVDAGFTEMRQGFDEMDRGFDETRRGFATLAAGMGEIARRLDDA
jgi:chromosome segregation ATPase